VIGHVRRVKRWQGILQIEDRRQSSIPRPGRAGLPGSMGEGEALDGLRVGGIDLADAVVVGSRLPSSLPKMAS
jgi:hypothetical protein